MAVANKKYCSKNCPFIQENTLFINKLYYKCLAYKVRLHPNVKPKRCSECIKNQLRYVLKKEK